MQFFMIWQILIKLKAEMDDSYIFVNATGVGMKPLEGQSVVPDKSYFRPELIVIDVPLLSSGNKDAFHGQGNWM